MHLLAYVQLLLSRLFCTLRAANIYYSTRRFQLRPHLLRRRQGQGAHLLAQRQLLLQGHWRQLPPGRPRCQDRRRVAPALRQRQWRET
jgi:hypothetical protein